MSPPAAASGEFGGFPLRSGLWRSGFIWHWLLSCFFALSWLVTSQTCPLRLCCRLSVPTEPRVGVFANEHTVTSLPVPVRPPL